MIAVCTKCCSHFRFPLVFLFPFSLGNSIHMLQLDSLIASMCLDPATHIAMVVVASKIDQVAREREREREKCASGQQNKTSMPDCFANQTLMNAVTGERGEPQSPWHSPPVPLTVARSARLCSSSRHITRRQKGIIAAHKFSLLSPTIFKMLSHQQKETGKCTPFATKSTISQIIWHELNDKTEEQIVGCDVI